MLFIHIQNKLLLLHNDQHMDTGEALKHPAYGGFGRKLSELVREGFLVFCQCLAYAVFQSRIDQKTQCVGKNGYCTMPAGTVTVHAAKQRASEQWQQQELGNVVDAPYFHLVFTLPYELNGWVRLHPEVIYSFLFRSVWGILNTLGHDPERLDGQLGMVAVLHTWGQNLSQHVHLHCLIPGGASSDDGEWHLAKSTYLFSVRVLSRLFCGKMVRHLREAVNGQRLGWVTKTGEVNGLLD